jgi:hypothetical protein
MLKVASRTNYAGHYAHNALLPVLTFVKKGVSESDGRKNE